MVGSGIFRTKLPSGFKASGIHCGVRVYRPDLGLLLSELDACTVGVFTKNKMKAAPVKYAMHCLPSEKIKAIITNSGEANAATGLEGEHNNYAMASSLASLLDCHPHQIVTASTGIIGKPLSLQKIIDALPSLLRKTTHTAESFATAILTTDLVPKTVYKDLTLSKGTIRITGICKGSGMIHPNMGTMLGYFLTDAQLSTQEAQPLLQDICDKSFNMISVDGETSTNDSVFLMANGASTVSLENAEDKNLFYQTILEMAITLAKSIARDGEGASKLIEAKVTGAQNAEQAKSIAKSIIISPLIKTAIYGKSPNWGRILSRIGQENIPESMLENCTISMQGIALFSEGCLIPNIDASLLQCLLEQDEICISVHFSAGQATACAWGCDLTEKYVQINAEYLS